MRAVTWVVRLAVIVGAGALFITGVIVAIVPRVWQGATGHVASPVELPELQPLAEASHAYDINGELLAIFNVENRRVVALDDIPRRVVDTFLAIEDRNFFHHDGVDLRSVMRAGLSNWMSDATRQGASTITMQVATNEFLRNAPRDMRYKMLQINYARWLEKELSKDEILERYLNKVYFGNNAYGVQAAAETYFGKNLRELTVAETGFLAGLVRSPATYDPIHNPGSSRIRFLQVLDQLVDAGLMRPQRAERVAGEFEIPWRVRRHAEREWERNYYTEALREYLLFHTDMLGDTYEDRYNQLYRGGLHIHTTADPDLQRKAEVTRAALPRNSAGIEAAIVALDSQTGAIRAMVGGSGFVPGEKEVNLSLAPHQTGSSAKIYVLAAALQAGARADDLIHGPSRCSLPDPNNPDVPYRIGPVVGSSTPRTLREHTYRSVNCAYSLLAQAVGLNRVVDMTYQMSMSPYLYPDQELPDGHRQVPIEPVASFAVGAAAISPIDMAAGAQTIAKTGVHQSPHYVDRIETSDGDTIYEHKSAGVRVLDEHVALEAIDILKDITRSGATGWRYPLDDDRPSAGKTGTYHNNTDATFVGFTPQLTTAVWMGHPDNSTTRMRGISEFSVFGDSSHVAVHGGRAPMFLWKTFMDAAHDGLPHRDWPPPPEPDRDPMRIYLPGYECVPRTALPPPPLPSPFANDSEPASDLLDTTSTPDDGSDRDVPLPMVDTDVGVRRC